MKLQKKLSVRVTEAHYKLMQMLVKKGEYESVSDAARNAVEKLLKDYEKRKWFNKYMDS